MKVSNEDIASFEQPMALEISSGHERCTMHQKGRRLVENEALTSAGALALLHRHWN